MIGLLRWRISIVGHFCAVVPYLLCTKPWLRKLRSLQTHCNRLFLNSFRISNHSSSRYSELFWHVYPVLYLQTPYSREAWWFGIMVRMQWRRLGLLDGRAHHGCETRVAVALFSSGFYSRDFTRCHRRLNFCSLALENYQPGWFGRYRLLPQIAPLRLRRVARNAVPPIGHVSTVLAIRSYMHVRSLYAFTTKAFWRSFFSKSNGAFIMRLKLSLSSQF